MMLRFENILFVAVPEADDDAVVERTLKLAESHQARLTVVDPRPADGDSGAPLPEGVTPAQLRQALAAASEEVLRPYVEAARGRVEVDARTLYGVGFVEIIRCVLGGEHDLVVKAAHGSRAGARGLLGSLDLHLLRKCPVPVWIAKPAEPHAYRRVLAAVDLDPGRTAEGADSLNRRILEAAAGQALADFAELHVVHAWQPTYEGLLRSRGVFQRDRDAQAYRETERQWHQQGLDRLGEQLRAWIGAQAHDYLQPRLHLRRAPPGEAIPAAVEELGADLLAMGTVGRTGISGLIIGNTAETILDGIECSVLAVKPPGFVTPVGPTD